MSIMRKLKRGTYKLISIKGQLVVCRRTSSVTKRNDVAFFDKPTNKVWLPISQG